MKFIKSKYRGFTLAELMIMLAVFAILLAAFAPIFTVRYKNASAEDVWAFVANDEEMDAYTDQNSNILTAQSFIGISPNSDADVLNAISSTNSSTGALYSKLVIRSHDNISGNEKQKQISFKYGDTPQGTTVGGLFAGGGNMLVGGNYKYDKNNEKFNPAVNFTSCGSSNACYNTAFGIGTLDSLTKGHNNTALGFNALNSLTKGNENTAIGSGALDNLTEGNRNTFAGTLRENATYSQNVNDNTIIGHQIGSFGFGNTFVGYNAGPSKAGNNNTAVGYNALKVSGTVGNANTAVGAKSLSSSELGSSNTAIGYNACSIIKGSNKTCIGYEAGASLNGEDAKDFIKDTDNEERVFIGSKPIDDVGGVSVLEVHNLPNRTSNFNNSTMRAGDSSVIINGNLVVRGQPYFTAKDNINGTAALIGFYVRQPKNGTNGRLLMGWDGRKRHVKVDQSCGGRCKKHAAGHTRTNCVCASNFGGSSPAGANSGILSYDWVSSSTGSGNAVFGDCQGPNNAATNGKNYKDNSLNFTYSINPQSNLNYAHRPPGYDSCCPDLRSDIRLKDVKGTFKGGLTELRQINIYNYTFKSDANKTPHVGVMAQDLKAIFPNAVTKDENGYYQIRWDEMLYAAINAIKTLDKKVENLAARISKDVHRIAVLKKDNAQLEQQVEKLSNELTLLESKTK